MGFILFYEPPKAAAMRWLQMAVCHCLCLQITINSIYLPNQIVPPHKNILKTHFQWCILFAVSWESSETQAKKKKNAPQGGVEDDGITEGSHPRPQKEICCEDKRWTQAAWTAGGGVLQVGKVNDVFQLHLADLCDWDCLWSLQWKNVSPVYAN